LLTSNAHQWKIATEIADATMEYMDHYDRRLKAATP
jgi:hypothetical protein